MKILLINHYSGSPELGMEFRPYFLAREWVQAGHTVTIVGASESHLRTKQPEIQGNRAEETLEDIRYIWLKTPSYSGNGLGRVKNIFGFLSRLGSVKNELADWRPDVVIASSTYPLDIYPASKIARLAGAKLAFEVHDLWPLSPIQLGGLSPKNPFVMMLQRAENFAYRNCDLVVSMLGNAEPYMREHGLAPGKFHYVPNGLDLQEWNRATEEPPEQHLKLLQELRGKGKFILGYTGYHGLANAMTFCLKAASLVKGEPITLVMVGQGPEKDSLMRQAADLDNVHFLPPVGKRSIPKLLEQMDALYIGWNRIPLYQYGVGPNKLIDYMMAAKPILHSIDASNDIVKESGSGISVPAEEPDAIAQGVRELMSMSGQERASMGSKGREYVLRHHDYRVLSKTFLEAVEHAPRR